MVALVCARETRMRKAKPAVQSEETTVRRVASDVEPRELQGAAIHIHANSQADEREEEHEKERQRDSTQYVPSDNADPVRRGDEEAAHKAGLEVGRDRSAGAGARKG